MNASFEEKSVWVTLSCMATVFAVYFVLAGRMLVAGVTSVLPFVPLFAVVVALLVVVLIVGHIVVAVVSRPDGRDERDRLIEWRAESNSSWLLGVGVVAAVFGLATPIAPAWIANGLLLALFFSEAMKQAFQLYYYRRGV